MDRHMTTDHALRVLERLSKQAVYEFSDNEPRDLLQVNEAIQVLRDALHKGAHDY